VIYIRVDLHACQTNVKAGLYVVCRCRSTQIYNSHINQHKHTPLDLCKSQANLCKYRCIGCLQLQVSFRKCATNCRALLREMTSKDRTSYGSSRVCICTNVCGCKIYIPSCRSTWDLHKSIHRTRKIRKWEGKMRRWEKGGGGGGQKKKNDNKTNLNSLAMIRTLFSRVLIRTHYLCVCVCVCAPSPWWEHTSLRPLSLSTPPPSPFRPNSFSSYPSFWFIVGFFCRISCISVYVFTIKKHCVAATQPTKTAGGVALHQILSCVCCAVWRVLCCMYRCSALSLCHPPSLSTPNPQP